MVRTKKLLVLLILSIFLSGCWDYQDVDDRSIVITVGVDRVDEQIELSTEVAKLKAELGEVQEKAEITNVYTDLSHGKNFEEARIEYDAKRPYPTFLGATRVVIFGTNFAKESIEPYLNRINKIYDYRKTLLPVVSRESPIEILNLPVEKDISVGFLIEDNINFLSKKGATIYPNIGKLLSSIASGNVGYLIPYIGIERNSVMYLGLAVMKDSKMIDVIETKDTDGLLYLLADNLLLTETAPSLKDEKNIYSFSITLKDRKIKTKYENETIIFDINVDLTGQLKYQYYREPINTKEIEQMEIVIAKKVKKDIEDIVEKSQKIYQCDIVQFAEYFRADNPKIYKQLDWKSEYPKAQTNVKVKVKIVNKNLADPNSKTKF